MKLWLIQRSEDKLSYDEVAGFVVRAESEEAARESLFKRDSFGYKHLGLEGKRPWKTAPCVELTADGDPGVILTDARNG